MPRRSLGARCRVSVRAVGVLEPRASAERTDSFAVEPSGELCGGDRILQRAGRVRAAGGGRAALAESLSERVVPGGSPRNSELRGARGSRRRSLGGWASRADAAERWLSGLSCFVARLDQR